MKTTVDLSDALLEEAKRVARAEATTLKALIEEGLRAVLTGRSSESRYVLPDAGVDGSGLQAAVRDASWEDIRALAYGDRQ